ncbi:MAG: HAMP domain-containing histidine kinase [Zoogloea sp.]|nr:HAMP domain-containing histidine kinase [Zoogloea sp.]
MQAAIGLMRQDPSRLEASIERIERETGRVDELVGQLLTLARLEAGSRDMHEEQVDLVDLAAAIADDAGFEAESLGRSLRFDGHGEAPAPVRVEQIQRAFDNVIRNALKFTPPGTGVDVRAAAGEGGFVLRVEDRGPGVAEADLEAIFEPFHRGGNGHTTGGFGLGLAIARRAVQAHGGRIQASNRAGGGLCVEIFLPLVPAALQKD